MLFIERTIDSFINIKPGFMPSGEAKGVSVNKQIKRILSFFEHSPKFNHCILFLEGKTIPIGAIDRKTAFKTYMRMLDDSIANIKGKVAVFEGIESYGTSTALEPLNIFFPDKTIRDVLVALTKNTYNGSLLDYIIVVDPTTKELVTFFTYKDVLHLLLNNSIGKFREIAVKDARFTKSPQFVLSTMKVEDRPTGLDENEKPFYYRSYPVLDSGNSNDFLGLLFDASIMSDNDNELICSDPKVMTHVGRFSNSILSETDNLEKAINGFIANPLHTSLPILRRSHNHNKLIGVVSYTDIFNYYLDTFSQQVES